MKAGKTAQQGFTLIELIVVLTIIAILAIVALPRLIETQRDARAAKARSIYGLLRSASALAHGRCMLDLAGSIANQSLINCATNPPQVDMEGALIRIVNRYPAATLDGIDSAAQINGVNDGLDISMQSGDVNTRIYDIHGGNAPLCRVSYQEAVLNGGIYIAPVISVVTTGC